MSRLFRHSRAREDRGPAGRTFRDRWPHDAAEADWLGAPWMPLALGSLAGLVGAPYLASVILSNAAVGAGLVAVTVALALVLRRGGERLVGRAWRALAWFTLVGLAGLPLTWAIEWLRDVMCPATGCSPRSSGDFGSSLVMVAAVAVSLVVSVGVAVLVDRAGRRIAGHRR